MSEYYILCMKHMHVGDFALLFWGPNNSGYRFNIDDAGVYGDEAKERFFDDGLNIAVEKTVIDSMKKLYVIDGAKLGHIALNNLSNRRRLGITKKKLLPGDSNWNAHAYCEPADYLRRNRHTLEIMSQILEAGITA